MQANEPRTMTRSPSYLDFASPAERPKRAARTRLEEGQSDPIDGFAHRLKEIEDRIRTKGTNDLERHYTAPEGARKLDELVEGKLIPEYASDEEKNYNKYSVLDRIGIILDFMDDHNVGKPVGFFAAHFGAFIERFKWLKNLFKVGEYKRAPETQEFYLKLRSDLETLQLQAQTYNKFQKGLAEIDHEREHGDLTQAEFDAIQVAIKDMLETLSPQKHLSKLEIERAAALFQSYANSVKGLIELEAKLASPDAAGLEALRKDAFTTLQNFASTSCPPFYSDAMFSVLACIKKIRENIEQLLKEDLPTEDKEELTQDILSLLKRANGMENTAQVPFYTEKKMEDLSQFTLLVYLALTQTNHAELAPATLKTLARIFSDKNKIELQSGKKYWSEASNEERVSFLSGKAQTFFADKQNATTTSNYVRSRMEEGWYTADYYDFAPHKEAEGINGQVSAFALPTRANP